MMTRRKQVRALMDRARIGRLAELRVQTGAPHQGDAARIQLGARAEEALNGLGFTSRSQFGALLAKPRRI